MKIFRIAVRVYILFFFIGCKQTPKRYLPLPVYNKLLSICDGNKLPLIVYYFDGDCSICLAKVTYLDEKIAKDFRLVLIGKTPDTAAFFYRIKTLNIKSCVYAEKRNEFERNIDFLKITKIDTDRSMENYDHLIPSVK